MDVEALEHFDAVKKENVKLREMISRLLGYDMDHQWDMIHHCDAKYDRGACDCGLVETLREAGALIRGQERDSTPGQDPG